MKFATVNYVSRIGTVFFPFPLVFLAFLWIPELHRKAWIVPAIVCGIVLTTLLYVWFFFLCGRLQFVCLDVILYAEQSIRASWQRRSHHWAWTLFKLGSGGAVVFGLLACFVPWVLTLSRGHGGALLSHVPFWAAFIFPLLSYFLLILFFLVTSVLNDFAIPLLATEEGVAWKQVVSRFAQLIRHEPGQLALYVLLKGCLYMAGSMAVTMGTEIVFVIVFLLVQGGFTLVSLLLHHMGVSGTVLGYAQIYAIFPVGVATMFCCMTVVMGGLMIFLDAYALYFFGGRCPSVGAVLEAQEPRLAYPPYNGLPPLPRTPPPPPTMPPVSS